MSEANDPKYSGAAYNRGIKDFYRKINTNPYDSNTEYREWFWWNVGWDKASRGEA